MSYSKAAVFPEPAIRILGSESGMLKVGQLQLLPLDPYHTWFDLFQPETLQQK
jgi:hypothetical protein